MFLEWANEQDTKQNKCFVCMPHKPENICCGHKMFRTNIKNIFCVSDLNFARAGKRGYNVSATLYSVCHRLNENRKRIVSIDHVISLPNSILGFSLYIYWCKKWDNSNPWDWRRRSDGALHDRCRHLTLLSIARNRSDKGYYCESILSLVAMEVHRRLLPPPLLILLLLLLLLFHLRSLLLLLLLLHGDLLLLPSIMWAFPNNLTVPIIFLRPRINYFPMDKCETAYPVNDQLTDVIMAVTCYLFTSCQVANKATHVLHPSAYFSFSTVRLHVVCGLPRFFLHSGAQFSAIKQSLLVSLLRIWSMYFFLLLRASSLMFSIQTLSLVQSRS